MASLAGQRGCGTRAHRVNPVEERSREVEDRSKDPGTHRRQVAEEDQDAGQGQYEDEPEENIKEELTIRPPGKARSSLATNYSVSTRH
jgi:hypothetical protein